MRIISGSAKGIRLYVLRNERTSPILDSVKESLFNILEDFVMGSTVLDLFAGTGTSGLEALSRGAKRCLFVDDSVLAIQVIHKNLKKTKLYERGRVLKKNVFSLLPFLKSSRTQFDLVFITPPYKLLYKERNERMRLFAFLDECASGGIISEKGIMMLQHQKVQSVTNEDFSNLHVDDKRVYGNTGLTFLRKKSTEM